MPKDAYQDFVEKEPKELLTLFKDLLRLEIPKDERLLGLNQGYQELAKQAHFASLQAMQSKNTILIRVSEFVDALQTCGFAHSTDVPYSRFSQLLECDVVCTRSQGQLCVGIHDDSSVIYTPFIDTLSPYSQNTRFISLPHKNDGTWLTHAEWSSFVHKLENNLDFTSNDLESQILAIWEEVDTDDCGEVFINDHPAPTELESCSEGRFRQIVLEHSGHTCLDLLYDCFSVDRES